jgi:hypothetical protein
MISFVILSVTFEYLSGKKKTITTNRSEAKIPTVESGGTRRYR